MQNVRSPDGVNALTSPRRLSLRPVGNRVDAAAESVFAQSSFRHRIVRNLASLDTAAYDKAGRVTSIKFKNEAPVSYECGTTSRLTVKTLCNGVRMEYQYAAALRLLGITYRKLDATRSSTA